MKHPIFFDPSETRRPQTKKVLFLLIVAIVFWLFVFALSLFLHPVLPLPHVFRDIASHSGFHKSILRTPIIQKPISHREQRIFTYTGVVSASDRKIYAFGVEWDDASFASLETNKEHIDALILEELSLAGSDMYILFPEKFKRTLAYLTANDPDLPVHALINNYNQSSGVWDTKLLYGILSDETSRKRLITGLVDFATEHHLEGINIDFEELDTATYPLYTEFLKELSGKLHTIGKTVSVNVPLSNDQFDLKEIAKYVDLIFLMAYDEHWSSASPGPIASQDWFLDGVASALHDVPREKLVVTIWNYGYDWTIWKKQSSALTFQEAHTIMRESETTLIFDTGSLNPMYSYQDDENKEHEVWYLDAATAYNQISGIATLGIGNISLWRLGSEDPSLWKIIEKSATPDSTTSLQEFTYGYDIDYNGTGEFYKLQSEPIIWKRHFSLSGNLITNEIIDTYPHPFVVARYGNPSSKKIALTFDDGPDTNYTPQVLDILKKEDILATFFVIGENSQKYPGIIKRIYEEWHLLWNHSFTHPDISKIGSLRTDMELISTERIIESITWHQTMIWRPPYGEDIEPETPDQMQPLINSKKLGYITVGMKIDPNDWANPGVDTIVKRTIEQIQSGQWNIILLHDAWGDRIETIQALPIIIRKLKSLGYEFVGVNTLLNIPREEMMPIVTGNDAVFKKINHASFSFFTVILWGAYYIFIITLIFGIVRLCIVILFAFLEKYHFTPRRTYDTTGSISVSIIVPAYNEAKVIRKTIDSLLLSRYQYFDIIVIDDGSTDGTSTVVQSAYGDNPRIKLFTRKNSWKGESMNYAITHTQSDVVIVIDADTIFAPDTISMLARHFGDKSVGAVSWNVQVWNRENILTNFQALEYNMSQNLDRRAYDVMNTITVVPGAVWAWRRTALLALGWFSADTLAEDSDMTMQLLRNSYTIHHEESAYAFTEAPSTWSAFSKQRFRWSFWVLQVTWKHIEALFQKKTSPLLRFFIFPSFIIFQIIVPVIAPLFDIFTIGLLITNIVSYTMYGSSIYMETLIHIALYSFVFLIFDFCIACIAISFEKNASWKLLYYFLPQRLAYRYCMYYINIKALWNALKWVAIGWDKLERSGTVTPK